MSNPEELRLLEISQQVDHTVGLAGTVMAYACQVAMRWLSPGARVLELGPAEGLMTQMLLDHGYSVDAVEGSPHFAEALASTNPGAKIHCSLFEDFEPSERFDFVIASHVLEHVHTPRVIVDKIATYLRPGGMVFAAVPNSHSLHRQAAVAMGMLERENSLNEADVRLGHRRVYDLADLRAEFIQHQWKHEFTGGYWLKPLSNSQIDGVWNPQQIQAFCELGEVYPDIAGEIYIVARRRITPSKYAFQPADDK